MTARGCLAGNVQQEQLPLVSPDSCRTPETILVLLELEIKISLNDICFHFYQSVGRLSLVSF